MQYLITFLEGVVSFLSPCMLPLLPAYVGYFAAGADRKRHTLARSLMFVAGFTLIFCLLGVTAGSLGAALSGHRRAVEIVTQKSKNQYYSPREEIVLTAEFIPRDSIGPVRAPENENFSVEER